MRGALSAWRDGVVEQLRGAGLNAVTAMDGAPASRWREAAPAVAVRRMWCGAGGGGKDRGGGRGPGSGEQRGGEGREAEITLALDIFAPRDGGGEACRRAAETAVECLVCQGAAGLAALEVRAGQAEFLERDGLYRQQVTCRCGAWLTARADAEAGRFTDFEVKGRVR